MTASKFFSLTATVLLGIAFVAGCSSSGRISEGDKAIEGFSKLKADLQKAQTQIDKTLTAMDQLNTGGDLSKSYKNFTKEVAELQKARENAKKRAAAMRENAQKYIEKWRQEMADVQDPSLRSSLEQRRQAVSANFERVRQAALAARDAYEPFIADLLGIQKALSIDLSPAALPGLRPSMNKAHQDGATLKQCIAAVQSQLDSIAAGMGAPPAAK